MKFNDGNWLMRPGVRAFHPAEAYEVHASDNALTIVAPTHPIRHRGDTLSGPILMVRLFAPIPSVIGVRVTRWEGGERPQPEYPITSVDHPVEVAVDEDSASLTTGGFTVRVSRKSWQMEFIAEGKVVTRSADRALGLIQTSEGLRRDGGVADSLDIRSVVGDLFMKEQLTIGVGEYVYGLGERFASFVKNGQSIDMWNRDGGTGSDQAYKNVPFYLTSKGYGVFVNHPEQVEFEVATEKVSRVQFSVPGESLEYYVIQGPTPKEVLTRYTALTGRSPLPPAWSFGLWLTTSFTTSYDEGTVTEVLKELEKRNLPLSVFHFDCFWMREFRWCDFIWDERVFPDPPAMLARLKERGLKICVWINPYIGQLSSLFGEAKAKGYLVKKPNGAVWQTDLWQPGMGMVDFTNPDACAWYASKLRGLLDSGVDAFKTDFGERVPVDVVWHDGSDPMRMHNYYSYLYNKVVFEVLREKRGEGDAVVFARSATAGCQQFPVHWGGDCQSSFESMAETLRGGLSLGLSGFGFWSHDIGGFEGMPPTDVYKRWIAFGLLSSHSRLHGSSSYRVPWLFDEEAVDVLRFFTRLKHRLMPYLYGAAVEASTQGTPVLRAMTLEFPEDPACFTLDTQFMLGGSLLVAPVFSSDNTVSFYLPEGTWTHLLTGETKQGGRWYREEHGFLSLPIYVRPNTVLPIGTEDDRPEYDWATQSELHVFAPDEGRDLSVVIPDAQGKPALAVTLRRQGADIIVTEGSIDAKRIKGIGL